jgi:hypothetical protein
VNVDAAFNYDTRRGLTGVVIRDHIGKFIAGSNRKIEHVLDPATSEALAFRDGIELATWGI